MKRSFQIGSAFVGLIVGAGFASGQEVMQYFTSFGVWGSAGGILATILFMILGFMFAQFGTDLQATSHKQVIYHIGPILDILITFFLFGVQTGRHYHRISGVCCKFRWIYNTD